MPSRKTLSYGIIALAGLAAPFGLQVGDGRVRLSQACSQATACVEKASYICSMDDADHVGYMCSAGCGS
jgi:hypothetical protein